MIEAILNETRRNAMAGGLRHVRRIHLRVGPASGSSPRHLAVALSRQFRGPLLDGCVVTWEVASEGGVALHSIEGIAFDP